MKESTERLVIWGFKTSSVIYGICYAAAHISAAVLMFQNYKLWVCLVALLVPGIGDALSIWALIKLGTYWPFILYGASVLFSIVARVLAGIADKNGIQA